jgi:predicted Zn-dependent peptidase
MLLTHEPNRKLAPNTGKILDFPLDIDNPITPFNFLVPNRIALDNGTPLLCVNAKSGAITRIDLAYKAGKWYQTKPLLAFFAGQLLKEGFVEGTSSTIAGFFEFYGAYLSLLIENDYAVVQLYCQNKHLPILLPVLAKVLRHPQYPAQELEALKMAQRQDLMISLEKVAFRARMEFNRHVFGGNHPYGGITMPHHFDEITRDDLVEFHSNTYVYPPDYILLSGFYADSDIKQLNECFGLLNAKPKQDQRVFEVTTSSARSLHIKHPNALQAALRIGKPSIKRSDSDYVSLQLLTTVLGGYFGSRLMRNIREDKGLAYGINAWLMPQLHAGSLVISSETNVDKGWNALEEIMLEVKKLTQEAVPSDELQLVKNYITGSFLRSIDGPFGLADRIRPLQEATLTSTYYTTFLNKLNAISAEELLHVAQTNFIAESFYTVTVGL